MVVGGPALEVSLSAARSGGDKLPSLSPLTQSRLSAIQLEQSLQANYISFQEHPCALICHLLSKNQPHLRLVS